jgi:hypothetical protein
MSLNTRLGLAATLVAAAGFLSGPVFAGEDCCGEQAKGEKTTLAARDAKGEKCAEAILAKLGAPAPKLSAEDAKALAEAKHTAITTCPAGKAMSAAIPEIAQAIEAVRALDAAMMSGGKDLPQDCQAKEGGCAFCAEAGAKMPEAAKAAMHVSMKSLARAEKLAMAIGGVAATFQGGTTKPAGAAHAIPTKEAYAKIAERMEALSKDLAIAMKKAKELPAPEQKKLDDAVATIEKIAPAQSPKMLQGACGALFGELGLAAAAAKTCADESPMGKDPKFVEGLSKNAQNAYALFQARTAVVAALGHICPPCPMCEGDEGGCCGGDQKGGCCEGEAKEKPKQ